MARCFDRLLTSCGDQARGAKPSGLSLDGAAMHLHVDMLSSMSRQLQLSLERVVGPYPCKV